MGKIKTAAHTCYYIRYHVVWVVKYRKNLLFRKEIDKTARGIFQGIAERYEFELEMYGTDGDHVHLFVGAAPRYSPARITQIMKSVSAREIFKAHPEIRKELWGGEFWGDGYYLGTVGHEVTESIVKGYIKNQGKETNHKKFECMQMSLF